MSTGTAGFAVYGEQARSSSYTEDDLRNVSSSMSFRAAEVESAESTTVRRLVEEMHEQHAQLRSFELQLNHANLQVHSLSTREADLNEQVSVLQFSVATVEQDKLLLESKLQDIAGFEGTNCSISLKDIRGKLLYVANGKITELSRALHKCQQSLATERSVPESEKVKLSLENQALHEEVKRISDQLAQRTVLYAAQERRYNDATRTLGSLQNEKDTENIQLRARLQQLEQQYERLDRSHIETVLQSKQLEETNRRLVLQLTDANEKAKVLDADAADLSSQNMSLQATVDRLRGADMVELERDLAAEVEMIRAESKVREDALRRQLESARDTIATEAERREKLVDEVERLRRDFDQQSDILREAADRSLVQVPHGNSSLVTPNDHSFTFISGTNNKNLLRQDRNTMDASGDNSVFAAMFSTLDDAGLATEWAEQSSVISPRSSRSHRYGDGDDDEEDKIDWGGQTDNASASSIDEELILPVSASSALRTLKNLLQVLFAAPGETTTPAAEEKLRVTLMQLSSASTRDKQQTTALWADARALTAEAIRVSTDDLKLALIDFSSPKVLRDESWDKVTKLMLETISLVSVQTMKTTCLSSTNIAEKMAGNSSLSKHFLVGAPQSEDGGTAESSFVSSNSTHHMPTTTEGLLREELACLKEELVRRKRKEQKLLTAYKDQSSKLSLVIKKASELNGPRLTHDDTDTSNRLQAEISVLKQQVEGFREELACAELHAESCRQLGHHEAAETYSCSIRLLEEELKILKAPLSCQATSQSEAPLPPAVSADATTNTTTETGRETSDAEVQANVISVVTGGDDDDSNNLREQIRILKQALLDSCQELEQIQSTYSKIARQQGVKEEMLVSRDMDCVVSASDEHSGSFASALSHAVEEDDERQRSMEEALRSHLRIWDERAETWTVEQTIILQKLGEAQNSLDALSAKHDDDKRQALASLRRTLETNHDEEMASLRSHHRDEVSDLIGRLQNEHSDAMISATKAMQLQLHRLIASLTQDHQLEVQQLEAQAQLATSLSSHNSTETSSTQTTAENDYGGDVEAARLLDEDIYLSKLGELKVQFENEMTNALSLLKQELELMHDSERRQLVVKYRNKLKRQEQVFIAEREQILLLVKQEYREIALEAAEVTESDIRNSLSSSFSSLHHIGEMLAPEVCHELIQGFKHTPPPPPTASSSLPRKRSSRASKRL